MVSLNGSRVVAVFGKYENLHQPTNSAKGPWNTHVVLGISYPYPTSMAVMRMQASFPLHTLLTY